LDNSLIGNVLELVRSIDKFLPNLVGKLDRRDEVAYTEAKVHRDLKYNAVIAAKEGKLAKKSSHLDSNHIVAMSLARQLWWDLVDMNARHEHVRLACKAPTSDQSHQFQNRWTKDDVIIYIRKEELRILYLRSALGPAPQFCLEANGVSSNKVDSSDMIVEKE
jgi:hypothetical protein